MAFFPTGQARFLGTLAIYLICACAHAARPVLLMPYFEGNGQSGVSLAWSSDGRHFQGVHAGSPIFTPPAWPDGQTLTRDPSIVWGDGRFHMVWTSSWTGRWFGYATSPDLVHWSAPKRVQPFPDGQEQPQNVWAPELLRDKVAGDYKVIWSSTLPSEFADGDGSEDSHGGDHRMYFIATKDFESYQPPAPALPDPGWSVIDGQVAWDGAGERWVMALKKEVGPERGGKNIRLAFSPPAIAPEGFVGMTEPIAGAGTAIRGRELAEGPSLVRWRDQWLLFWDGYKAGRYAMASSPDLASWTDETSKLRFPVRHPRHGTVFAADAEAIGWPLEP